MKPIKSKAQLRRELEQQIRAYLGDGGKVNRIASGLSGLDIERATATPVFDRRGPTPHTDVNAEIQALEARKRDLKQGSKKTAKKTVDNKPKKVLLRDDFGEPLRWVWR